MLPNLFLFFMMKFIIYLFETKQENTSIQSVSIYTISNTGEKIIWAVGLIDGDVQKTLLHNSRLYYFFKCSGGPCANRA